jgi:hypothetical protein
MFLPVFPDEIHDPPVILGHVIDALFIRDRACDLIVPQGGFDHEPVLVEFDYVLADFQLDSPMNAKSVPPVIVSVSVVQSSEQHCVFLHSHDSQSFS